MCPWTHPEVVTQFCLVFFAGNLGSKHRVFPALKLSKIYFPPFSPFFCVTATKPYLLRLLWVYHCAQRRSSSRKRQEKKRKTNMELVKDNPLLLPLNQNKTVFDGFISVKVRVTSLWPCGVTVPKQVEWRRGVQSSIGKLVTSPILLTRLIDIRN